MVITWLPNSEITSVWLDLQKGQRLCLSPPCFSIPPWAEPPVPLSLPPCGEGRGGGSLSPGEGLALPTGGHVALLGQPLQHVKSGLIDPAGGRTASNRIPLRPVDIGRVRVFAELFSEQTPQVADPGRQFPVAVELIDVAVFGTEPFDRLPPGARHRVGGPAL